jgi:hypothetical protein
LRYPTFGLGRWWIAACVYFPLTAGDFEFPVLLSAPEGTPDAVVCELRREAGRLLSPAGMSLSWRKPGEAHPVDYCHRAIIMRLTGVCTGKPVRSVHTRAPLGRTHAVEGRILPLVDINCNDIVAYIEVADPQPSPATLGRALGRVAAHELYHVLTTSAEHDQTGITKSALSRLDLLTGDIDLNEDALLRLREALPLSPLERHAGGDECTHTEE